MTDTRAPIATIAAQVPRSKPTSYPEPFGCCPDIVARDAGDAGEPLEASRTELDEPFVVDAHHLGGRRVVVQPPGRAENAVQHLRMDAVQS